MPVVSRLYSPEDFRILATFTAIVSILSVAMCLRLDVAVPLPDSDADAAALLALALGSCLLISIPLLILMITAPGEVSALLRRTELKGYLWAVPISAMLAGWNSALQHWFVRRRAFEYLAASRVSQSFAAAACQIGSGWAGIVPSGLLLGQVLNSGAGAALLGVKLVGTEMGALRAVTIERLRSVLATYSRFPRISTIESLANSAAIHAPIIVIGATAAAPEAGSLSLAMFSMQMPLSLLGNAVSQVYLSRAPEEHRTGRLGTYTAGVIVHLLEMGLGPLCFVGILGPELFQFVFGAAWARSGELVMWMTPWFAMQFVAVPVSMALHITGWQAAALWLQVFGLLVRVGATWLAPVRAISECYAVSGFVSYALYAAVVMRAASVAPLEIARRAAPAAKMLAAWIATAVAGKLAVQYLRAN